MIVKLCSARVGHRIDRDGHVVGTFAQSVGDVVDIPEAEAKRMIDAGLATVETKRERN